MALRKRKRVPFQATAYFSVSPGKTHDHRALVTDLTDQGACIKTKIVHKPGTRLNMVIHIDDMSYKAEGVVAWWENHYSSSRLAPVLKCRMGIRFTHVDPGVVEIYQQKMKADLVRHDP
jgi:hypothetical protein